MPCMPRNFATMRLLAFLFILLAVTAPARASESRLYLIENAAGETLGWQREQPSGQENRGTGIIERQLTFRVDGHGLQQQYLRIETGPGNSAPVVSMGKTPADARRVHAQSVYDLSDLQAIMAAADGKALPGYRLLGPADASGQMVERSDPAGFVGAWVIQRDGANAVLQIRQPRLEGDWIFRPVPTGAELSHGGHVANMAHPMVDAPYDIPGSARRGRIRYEFRAPAGLGMPLPETAEQRVRLKDGNLAQVDVCSTCGTGLSTSAQDLAEWTQPTSWLESDAPALRLVAARARRSAKNDTQVMRRLSRVARKRLADVDYDGHYSALAAWHRRRGDCTEDAVLLAALARSAGIPARVVTGLAYERHAYHGTANAFLPHAWTLAYVDGQWRSFDLSLGRFSAGHIAFAITDGEAAAIQSGWQLAAMFELEDMAEVRPTPIPGR